MVDRAAAARAQDDRCRRTRTAYLVARDAALPAARNLQAEQEFTAGWIALRFLNDPATAAQHFARDRRRQRQPDRAGARRLLAGPRRRSRRPPQEARDAYTAAAAHSTSYYGQLARAKLGLPQIRAERRSGPATDADSNSSKSCARRNCCTTRRARTRDHDLRRHRRERPTSTRLRASANWPRAMAMPAACCCSARPRSTAGYRSTSMPSRPTACRIHVDRPDGRAEHRVCDRAAGKRVQSARVSSAKAYGLMQVTPDAGRYIARKFGADFRSAAAC